jgi:hypothetical protein
MILRPAESADEQSQSDFQPAWSVVEKLQKAEYKTCRLVTQPSHAALAGQMASRLNAPDIPKLDAELVRAIALHDAGWGMPDAQQVMRSRTGQLKAPHSFLQCSVGEFLAAWTQSIDTAQSISPAGGYIVSRHFWRLAEHRLKSAHDEGQDRKALEGFTAREAARQTQLGGRQQRSITELEQLTDVLQFCDLLSLYVCCGAKDKVEFPEFVGKKVRVTAAADRYSMSPNLIEPGSRFLLATLFHPAGKGRSGEEIEIIF